MAQFDVYRLEGGQLVVDLQTDLLGLDASRIVAPLRDASRFTALPGLTPDVEVAGQRWLVRIPELAAVPGHLLKDKVGDLAQARDPLKRAIDMLIDGV